MKRWETYLITTALAAGLTGAPLAWGQQQMPKSGVFHLLLLWLRSNDNNASSRADPATVTGAQVNINSADEAALTSVKGVGKAKAKAIIEYREKNGPFQSVDDLTKIKGIKSKSLQKFKNQLTVG